MEFFWIVLLVPLFYFPVVVLISLIAALFAGRKGKKRDTFRQVFLDFFWEFLNPLNWLS